MPSPRPVRAPHTDLLALPGGGVLVRTPAGVQVVDDPESAEMLLRLWPLLDGTRTPAALRRELGEDVADVVDDLRETGLVTNVPLPDGLAGLFHHVGTTGPRGAVRVTGGGELADCMKSGLRAYGLKVLQRAPRGGGDVELTVAAPDSPDPGLFAKVNATALASGTPALFVEPGGWRARVGPLVLPGKSACWQCRELRAWGNVDPPEVHEVLRAHEAVHRADAPPLLPAALHVLAGLASAEAARGLSAGEGTLVDAELEVNLWDLTFDRAPVLRVPGCPACGKP